VQERKGNDILKFLYDGGNITIFVRNNRPQPGNHLSVIKSIHEVHGTVKNESRWKLTDSGVSFNEVEEESGRE
jgi:hypothetical protein